MIGRGTGPGGCWMIVSSIEWISILLSKAYHLTVEPQHPNIVPDEKADAANEQQG